MATSATQLYYPLHRSEYSLYQILLNKLTVPISGLTWHALSEDNLCRTRGCRECVLFEFSDLFFFSRFLATKDVLIGKCHSL